MANCPTGYLYYTCVAIDFSGCCALDPCNGGCPGTAFFATSTSATSATTTTVGNNDSTTTISQNTGTHKPSSPTPAPPPAPAQTTQTTTSAPATSTVAPFSSVTAAASTSSSSSTTTPTASSQPSTQGNSLSRMSRATVAGATVGAIFALAMLIILIFLFRLYRRRNRASQRRSTLARRNSTKLLEPASTDDDIFAPYGGFYRGSSDATSPATPSLRPNGSVMNEKLAPPPEPQQQQQQQQQHLDAGPPTPRTKHLIDNPSRDIPAVNADEGPAQLDDTQLRPPKRLSQQGAVEMADTSWGVLQRRREEGENRWKDLVGGRQSAPFPP